MKNKINIDEIKLLLPDYITGSLNENERSIVENAIRSDSEIADIYNDMKNTLEFVETIKFEEPVPQYWNNLLPRIHEKIEAKQQKKLFKNPVSVIWKILVPVAAIILIAILYKISISPQNQITEKNQNIINQETMKVDNTQPKVDIEKKENVSNKDENKTGKHEKPVFKKKLQTRESEAEDQIGKKSDEYAEQKLKGELESADISDLEYLSNAEVYVQDEEIESEIDKLNNNDKDMLLDELSKTNM